MKSVPSLTKQAKPNLDSSMPSKDSWLGCKNSIRIQDRHQSYSWTRFPSSNREQLLPKKIRRSQL